MKNEWQRGQKVDNTTKRKYKDTSKLKKKEKEINKTEYKWRNLVSKYFFLEKKRYMKKSISIFYHEIQRNNDSKTKKINIKSKKNKTKKNLEIPIKLL